MSYAFCDFLWDFSRIYKIPIDKLLDETKIEEEPSGYILEYGETGTRIQTADKKYEYRWCESSFEDKGVQQEYMEEAFDFIQKIRPGPLRHIKICPTWRDHFRGIIPRKCNVLSLGTDASMYTDYDMETVPDCGKLDIAALLQCIDFQKGLALNGPKVLKTAHSKILSIDWLRVANCRWMRASHLESFRNKCIYLSDVKFTEKEVNEFLWNFKEGFGNENLEVMTLKRKEGEWWNRKEVLDQLNVRHVDEQKYSLRGIDPDILNFAMFLPLDCGSSFDDKDSAFFDSLTLPSSPSYMPPAYHPPTIDNILITNAHVFQRDDGVWVTVDVQKNEIRIFVWSSKLPKKQAWQEENRRSVD
ncbi:unnamed protein product [Caenorhabditis brenneri]